MAAPFLKEVLGMRKLMWFALGFAAACACAAYLLQGQWLLWLALICLPGVALLFINSMPVKRLAVFLLGCAIGFGWCYGFDALYIGVARTYDDQVLQLQVEASDYSENTDYGCRGTGYVMLDGKEYAAQYYLDVQCAIAPGDRIWGEFQVHLTTPSATGESINQSASGIYLRLYLEGAPSLQRASERPLRYFGAEARHWISEQIEQLFPEDAAGFAQALLLGDRSLIPQEQMTDMKVSGIAHIIAVSGLHVAILLSLVYLFTGDSSRVTAVLGIPVMFLFAVVAGFSPSVVRACLMQSLMLLSYTFEKEYDPPTSLAFAAVTMLVINPMTIASVSFQLSVCCIIGIILFSRRISKYLLQEKRLGTGKGKTLKAKLTRFVAASVSVSISTAITTIPLCALYFGTVSIISILTNLLTIWTISYIFYGLLIALVVGLVWQPLGQIAAYIVTLGIRYVTGVAHILAELPFAAVYTRSAYIVCWVILCYMLLAVYLYCRKKRPVMLCAGIIVSLVLAVGASCVEPLSDRYRITMLDVGQGQCILIQSKNKHYMVDCGSDYPANATDAAVQTLYSQGVTQLDGLIVTHFDADHTAGIPALLSEIDVETVYMPFYPDADSPYKQQIESANCHIEYVDDDTQLSDGNINIHIYPIFMGKSQNKYGLCVLFQVEDCDILITGDLNTTAEKELLKRAALPKIEILVAGHHGAQDATSLQLLRQVQPEYALISAGVDNRYHHPSYETLQKLAMFDVKVRRTDLEGTILIRG